MLSIVHRPTGGFPHFLAPWEKLEKAMDGGSQTFQGLGVLVFSATTRRGRGEQDSPVFVNLLKMDTTWLISSTED